MESNTQTNQDEGCKSTEGGRTPVENSNGNSEVEWQTGSQDIGAKQLQAAGEDHDAVEHYGTSETIGWLLDPEPVIEYLADKMYDSEEATVREFVANAETACLRTQAVAETGDPRAANDGRAYGYVESEYSPVVEINFHRENRMLTIQDNGLGISLPVFDEVLRQIGRSMVRDTGQFSGQFGMGFLSFAKLVGRDNAMIMKTHARDTDDNYAMYFSLGGIDPIPGGLPEDEFGTRFEMNLRRDISDEQIRSYVERYTEGLRVPVVYREYDETGAEVFNEDWGDARLEDDYQDNQPVMVLEDEFVRATSSPNADGDTLLISMPIERNDSNTQSRAGPWQFDVRLLDESGVVWKGPHRGLVPVPDGEYMSMSEKRQEHHVAESDLDEEDIALPKPITSRDRLQENDEFWEELAAEMKQAFLDAGQEVYESHDTRRDILNMTDEEFYMIMCLPRNIEYTIGELYDEMKNVLDTSNISERFVKTVEYLMFRTECLRADDDEVQRRNLYQIMQYSDLDAPVYYVDGDMDTVGSEEAESIVEAASDNSQVIWVNNGHEGEVMKDLFDWQPVENAYGF